MSKSRAAARAFVAVAGVIALALVVGGATGCARSTVFASADAGKTIEIAVGETFEIELVSNPTTGYSWQVDEIDEAVAKQVGEPEYSTEAQKEEIVGAAGVERFAFEGVAAGEFTLRLVYVRPWEYDESSPTIEPESEFTITVVVLK